MPYKILTVFLFSLFHGFLIGQNVSDEGFAKNQNYLFRNRPYPDSIHYNTSYLIQELALANNQRKSEVTFRLNYDLITRVTTNDPREYIVGIVPKMITGNTRYMNFEVGDHLFPSDAKLMLNVSKNKFLRRWFEIDNIELVPHDTAWVSTGISYTESTEVIIPEIEFYYDEQAKSRILNRFNLITDYFATTQIIDSLINYADRQDFEDADRALSSIAFLFELENIYHKIRQKAPENSLPLKLHDPAQLLSKMEVLGRRLNRVRTLSTQLLSDGDFEPLPSLRIDLFNPYIEFQKTYLDWASMTSHYYQDSYYDLLEKDLGKLDFGIYEQYASRVPGISSQSEYDKEQLRCLFLEANQVFIEHCIDRSLFTIALDLITSLDEFNNSLTSCNFRSRIQQARALAVLGLYDSYMTVAERAITINNFSFGIDYLRKADDFRSGYPEILGNDRSDEKVLNLLANQYVNYAGEQIMLDNYSNAIAFLKKARKLQAKHPGLHINEALYDSTMIRAKRGGYQNYLAMASKYFNQGDYEEARRYLNMAEDIKEEKTYLFSEDVNRSPYRADYPLYESYLSEGRTYLSRKEYQNAYDVLKKAEKHTNGGASQRSDLTTLLEVAASGLIDKKLMAAKVSVFQGRTAEAERMLVEVRKIIREDALPEEDYEYSISEIEGKSETRECDATWKKYESRTLDAFSHIDNQEFIEAEKLLLLAVQLMDTLSLCQLADSIAWKAYVKFHPAAVYQQKLSGIRNTLFTTGFADVIEQLIGLEEYYVNHRLQDLNIEPVRLRDFLLSQENPELFFTSMDYFLKKNDWLNAWQLLELYKETGYGSLPSKEYQQHIADLCFEDDMKNETEGDADSRIITLTKNDNWFKYFEKRYRFLSNKNKVKTFFEKSD